MAEPSSAQLAVLSRMALADGRLYRYPGGSWCTTRDDVGTRVCNVHTVRALERLGFLARAYEYPEEWRDTRQLTVAACRWLAAQRTEKDHE